MKNIKKLEKNTSNIKKCVEFIATIGDLVLHIIEELTTCKSLFAILHRRLRETDLLDAY